MPSVLINISVHDSCLPILSRYLCWGIHELLIHYLKKRRLTSLPFLRRCSSLTSNSLMSHSTFASISWPRIATYWGIPLDISCPVDCQFQSLDVRNIRCILGRTSVLKGTSREICIGAYKFPMSRQAGVDKRSLLIVNLFVDLCPIYLPLSWLDSYRILY